MTDMTYGYTITNGNKTCLGHVSYLNCMCSVMPQLCVRIFPYRVFLHMPRLHHKRAFFSLFVTASDCTHVQSFQRALCPRNESSERGRTHLCSEHILGSSAHVVHAAPTTGTQRRWAYRETVSRGSKWAPLGLHRDSEKPVQALTPRRESGARRKKT